MSEPKHGAVERDTEVLDIVGADANNLRDVSVRIPLHRVTVVTGVSGSGKSSLLADTLAVEADRRMRLFLGVHQPHLEGTPPHAFIGSMPAAIHVGQRAFRASARTTVGTATGLLTALRRLFSAHARPYSDELGRDVPEPSPASYAGWLVKHYRGRATVSAVPVYFVATDGVRCAERLRELGISEVVVRSEGDSPKAWERGRVVPLAKWKPLRATVKHIIEANLGAVEITPKVDRKKLEALLQKAFDAGQGQALIDLPDAAQPELRGPFGPRLNSALHWVDADLPTCFSQPGPHLLSFNAPEHRESGACKTCQGIGRARTLDERALVTHPERSMRDGAFALFTEKNYKYVNIQHATIEGLRGMRGFSPDVPWNKLSEAARRLVVEGAGAELVTDKDPKTGRNKSAPHTFEGFRRAILDRAARGTKTSESLASLVSEGPCPECSGTRWSYQARALRIDGVGIHHLLAQAFLDLAAFTGESSPFARAVPRDAAGLVRLVHHHAAAFVSVGLGHLTGDRGMLDISEGESRRARLAAVLNARHAGLCLLLDEPARGLHDEDVQNLAVAVADLARAHTVVMNEHRHALVENADHVIELGPGAGSAGGEIVREGPVARSSWARAPSLDRARMPVSPKPTFLTIHGASIHNLDRVDCAIPLGRLTCLTGVSGSGKSNFVRGVLVPAVAASLPSAAELDDFDQRRGTWSRIEGTKSIKGLVALDQKAPPANRRSIVATFLDMAEVIRVAFGSSEPARKAGLSTSDFGLNAGGGRCQFCLGIGEVEEHDQWTPCPVCGGTRFGEEVLSVRVDGMSIHDLLDAPAAELHTKAPAFLAEQLPVLVAMMDLGIGHIALGRRVDTLSGGEVQRLRIAAKLAEHGAGGLLFVLDEPAAGLHPHDVERLVRALDRILDQGRNTVVLVEHNPAIIHASDWLVEFGPGSGPHGGRVVAHGPPEEVAKTDTATGRVLSGRSGRVRPRHDVTRSREERPSGDPVKRAHRVRAWMRRVIGDDVAVPDEAADDTAMDRPAVILDDRFWKERRASEIGGLDLEIAKLLLDVEPRSAAPDRIEDLARYWANHPDARLMIHPFLKDIQVWGPRLPISTIQEATKHLRAMGLELDPPVRHPRDVNCLTVRATGERFISGRAAPDERARFIEDALALGGGYVEVRGPRGHRDLVTRLLDLESGIVAPRVPAPFHFSRHDHRGQCRTCRGTGQVLIFDEGLVLGDRRATPEDESFLKAPAAAVMKGVRRGELLPFFKRLAEEGLWERSTGYQDLDDEARGILLFGYWKRPSHGTFLKSAKEDPSEVGAWLRWDGLYHALAGQLERSTDARWKAAVHASRAARICPSCEGTGLAQHAKLLRLGDRSLYAWVRDGTVGELHRALKGLKTPTERQQRTRDRILACLAPVAKAAPSQPLREQVDGQLARDVSERIVREFTDMPVVIP